MNYKRALLYCAAILSFALPAVAFADTSFTQFLSQLETQYGLPSGLLGKVAMIENGGKATGCAPTSSACGMFQWTTNSWLSATKALYGAPLSLDQRNSPTESAKVTAYELDVIKTQIGSTITQAKVDMSVGLYLGHFLGSGGARQLLNAYIQNPATSACSILPKACAANRSVLSQSVAGVINTFAQKMQVAGVPNVAGNFQDTNGVSYAYSSADLNSSSFLPANTVISTDPQYDYPTVYPSVVNSAPVQSLPTTPSLPYAPQTTPPASYTTPATAAAAVSASAQTQAQTGTTCTTCTTTNATTSLQSGTPLGLTLTPVTPLGSDIPQGATSTILGILSEESAFFATSTPIATTSSSTLENELLSIVNEGTSTNIALEPTSTGVTSGTVQATGTPAQNTLVFGSEFEQTPAPAQLSPPLLQVLNGLKNVLSGFLVYLQHL